MTVQVSHRGVTATRAEVPEFPMLRVDSARLVYQEALIDGQYLGAHLSAMGRPRSRLEIWEHFNGATTSDRPLRTRQHAFLLEVDGQLLADRWVWVDSNPDGSVVTLQHEQRPVTVEVHTSCDQTSFFTRHLVITNTGDRPCALAKVAPWSGLTWNVGAKTDGQHWFLDDIETAALPGSPFSVGRMTDSSLYTEGAFDWVPLPSGHSGFESMQGRSGYGPPFCIVRNEATGELLVVNLAWSGNWSIGLFNDFEPARLERPDARAYIEVGLAGPAPLRVLEPNESVSTPKVHVGALFGNLDTAVQALHQHIRTSVALSQPASAQHLVELNTWAAAPGEITEEQLYAEIELASELGAELFVMDDGWWGGTASSDTIGDWDRESPLLTKGLSAAFDHARAKGMRVGLWVEPERIGLSSRTFAKHPDWVMQRRGKPVLSNPENSANLDLSNPAAARHFESTIADIIERYNLDCFRIDYNHQIGEGGVTDRSGFAENVMWRHYDAFYQIFDNLRDRFPHLLLENCSSGGGRMDLGIMSRFHWVQVTDRSSPGPAARIVNGVTMMLPPEMCEVLTGFMGGVSDMDFLIRISLFGHFDFGGIFPTVEDRNPATWDRWRHGIDVYKEFCRPMLPTSRMFHHTPIQRQSEPGEWIVWECADPSGDRAFIGVFRLLGATGETYTVRPRGLRPDRVYRIAYDSLGWIREVSGGTLIDDGIRVPVPSALTSELLLIESI